MHQSQSSINRFIRKMSKCFIPKEQWNDINRESLELKAVSNRVGFSLSSPVAGMIIFSLSASIFSLVVALFFGKSGVFSDIANKNSVLYNAFEIVSYVIFMFVPFMLMGFLLKRDPFSAVNIKHIKNKAGIFPAAVITLSFYFIGTVASELLEYIMGLVRLKPYSGETGLPDNIPAAVLYIVLICAIAPVFEEFIFRGFIMQNLRKFGNIFAIVVSSLLFAMLHGNLVQIPFAFIAGLALGYFAIKLDSIWASVFLHALINTISTVIEIFSLYFSDEQITLAYTGLFIIILLLSMIYIASIYKKDEFSLSEPKDRVYAMPSNIRSWSFFLTPGFIVFASITLVEVIFYIRIV